VSWEQLGSILAEQRLEADAEARIGLVACPNDGEPLTTGPDGRLFCRYDGFRP
jgi:hypothetical protein